MKSMLDIKTAMQDLFDFSGGTENNELQRKKMN